LKIRFRVYSPFVSKNILKALTITKMKSQKHINSTKEVKK